MGCMVRLGWAERWRGNVDWCVWMKIYGNKPRLVEMDVQLRRDEANICAVFWSYTHHIYLNIKLRYNIVLDCLCGLVVRVPGYIMEMYCVSCEVRTQFIYVM
jgi:hypothetical protein